MFVEYRVDKKGKVADARVIQSAPNGVFDDEILREMREWRYDVENPKVKAALDRVWVMSFDFQISPCGAGYFRLGDVEDWSEVTVPGPTMFMCVDIAGLADLPPMLAADHLVVGEITKRQTEQWEYLVAVKEIEQLQIFAGPERLLPHDPSDGSLRLSKLPVPVVSPSLRRAQKPLVALVTFDVSGDGRTKNVVALSESSGELNFDLVSAVNSWLFRPAIEEGRAISRAGYSASLVVEFSGEGQQGCGTLKAAVDVDFETRVCFDMRAADAHSVSSGSKAKH